MNSDREDDDTASRQGGAAGTASVSPDAAAAATAADRLADGHALPLGTRLGEFELTDRLGEGGFSIVYLAWDHSLERRVALKEYMPGSVAERRGATQVGARSEAMRETFELGLRSFINESRLLALFDHPALVKVYRFWEANGTAYMVMPFYEGRTLKDALHGAPAPPTERWLLDLLASVTEALGVIHAKDCFHRDIAPDNIMLLAPDDRPLLLDFGAARRVIGNRTQALTVILKPGYAPIEQYADAPDMKQGPWTDVYALAAVVYWAITGKKPAASVSRMLKDNHVPLASIAGDRYSARFLAAIDHGLALLPENRPQTIRAFRSELGLEAAAPESGATLPPPAATTSVPHRDEDATQWRPVESAPSRTITQTHSLPGLQVVAEGAASRASARAEPHLEPETPRTAPSPIDPRDDRDDEPDAVDDDEEPDQAGSTTPEAPTRRRVYLAPVIGATVFSATAVILWAVMREPGRQAVAPPPAPRVSATNPGGTPATAALPMPQARVVPTAPASSALDIDSHVSPTPPTTVVEPPAAALAAHEEPRRASPASSPAVHRVAATRTKPPPRAETGAAPNAANSEECARIMQRLSLGESSSALIERVKTLNCR